MEFSFVLQRFGNFRHNWQTISIFENEKRKGFLLSNHFIDLFYQLSIFSSIMALM